MQFVYPGMLWALFLLIIPVIIHLFQLRKFQKEAFTNVALLKKIEVQTRKSSRLKKWLVFSARMLAATAVIIAFAQPFYAHKEVVTEKSELVIYLDNSFSMQARGSNGALLKKAVQDIIENIPEDMLFTLFTNDKMFKKTTVKAIRNELLALEYSPGQYAVNEAVLKGNAAFTDKNTAGNILILLSDFQRQNNNIDFRKDSLSTISFVKLSPQNTYNISIDSLYISGKTPNGFTLTAKLGQQENTDINIPVSLFNNEVLTAKTSAAFEASRSSDVSFDMPSEMLITGKLSIEEENGLLFDNTLHFTINQQEKINVLAVSEADNSFLERIYTEAEFNLISVALDALDYNLIASQNVIVLNELKTIPNALGTTLQSFAAKGGSIVVIPSEDISYSSYNQLLKILNVGSLSNALAGEKKIIAIAYSHPVFENVFEKQVQNFQYPDVKSFYPFTGTASAVLQLENNAPFLVEKNNSYIFTTALNANNSNFKNSPLIVPLFYNIGKNSIRLPELYYTIGRQNQFDVKTKLQKDDIISLSNAVTSFIPQQQAFDNKVALITSENPAIAGAYTISSGENTISHVSFNYNRNESALHYHNIDSLQNISVYNSIPQLFTKIKNENNSTALWKWFAIFALAMLITELLLLKFFK